MPLIEVTLAEGRSADQIRHDARGARAVLHRRHPARTHRVIVREVPRTHWATGDLTLREMDAGKANPGDKETSRFSLFVHMERWDDQVSHRQLFENLTELTLMAEAGGFSTVWIGAAPQHGIHHLAQPDALLAYLAGQTSTIRLGAGTIIAPFWNPIRVAGERAARRDQQRPDGSRTGPRCLPVRVRPDARRVAGLRGGKYLRELVPVQSCGRATMRTTVRSGSSRPRPVFRSRFSSRPADVDRRA